MGQTRSTKRRQIRTRRDEEALGGDVVKLAALGLVSRSHQGEGAPRFGQSTDPPSERAVIFQSDHILNIP